MIFFVPFYTNIPSIHISLIINRLDLPLASLQVVVYVMNYIYYVHFSVTVSLPVLTQRIDFVLHSSVNSNDV